MKEINESYIFDDGLINDKLDRYKKLNENCKDIDDDELDNIFVDKKDKENTIIRKRNKILMQQYLDKK